MMLLNPTGGLIGGDYLRTNILLGPGTHVCMTTPSATRVYRTDGPPVIQETTIRLEEDAVLEFIPEHVIPHPGSALRQSLRAEMAPGSCLILNDGFAAGRVARNELWQFQELSSSTEILLGDRLVYLNRTRIVPSERIPLGLGTMEGFHYTANLTAFSDRFNEWPKLVDELASNIDAIPAIRGGASETAHSGCIVRLLAPAAQDLTSATQKLWALVRGRLLQLPPLDLRKY